MKASDRVVVGAELSRLFNEVVSLEVSIKREAVDKDVNVYDLRSSTGDILIAPVILAKAQTLNAIVHRNRDVI